MFIDTDEHGEQVQWKGPMDKENHTLLPTQPPHNQIYQQSWPDYPLPANRHQSLDELADLPPIKSTRMPWR